MDDVVRRLARAARTNPFSVEIARDYERTLARAGRRATLRLRREARYLCPWRFEDGFATEDPMVRSCRRCGPVAFAADGRALVDLWAAGAEVALERPILPFVLADLVEGRSVDGVNGPPQLHATDLRFTDLDGVEVSNEVLNILPSRFARMYLAYPVELSPETVYVALGDPSAEGLLSDLEELMGLEVRQLLAPRSAVERAVDERPPTWLEIMDLRFCDTELGVTGRHDFLHRRRRPPRDAHRAKIADDGWLGD